MKFIYIIAFFFISNTVFSQSFHDVDEYAKSIKISKNYKAAAHQLADPYKDEQDKARAIFTWLAYHIKYDFKQLNRAKKNSTIKMQGSKADFEAMKVKRIEDKMLTALKKKRGVCQDYSWLFKAMLEEVGIEVEFVNGHSRTSRKLINRLKDIGDHAWNVAKINGNWHHFDVTWSTDMFENQHNGFFMMSTIDFMKSHFPIDSQWQFLEEPILIENWKNQVFWHKTYVSYKDVFIKAGSDIHGRIDFPRNEVLSINMKLKKNQVVYATKGKKRVPLKGENYNYFIDMEANKLRGFITFVVHDKTTNIVKPLFEINSK